MKHNNISFFVPHIGCPHCCTFCDQRTITSKQTPLTSDEVITVCNEAINQIKDKQNTEIAFFGGSFTAIKREYMIELLETANRFIGEGKFHGIRISTRPDYINKEILDILKKYGVTSIELGVQSMSQEVLDMNNRGHSTEDVEKAVNLIKDYGFELGLQMMVGLYGSDYKTDMYTAKQIVRFAPKTVRIYPTVILDNTELGEFYKNGTYIPMELHTTVDLCADLLQLFEENNIQVIRLGLHASTSVEQNMLGGIYHPAFKELCEGQIFRKKIKNLLGDRKEAEILVSNKSISKAIGQKKCNLKYFKDKGVFIKITPTDKLKDYEIELG